MIQLSLLPAVLCLGLLVPTLPAARAAVDCTPTEEELDYDEDCAALVDSVWDVQTEHRAKRAAPEEPKAAALKGSLDGDSMEDVEDGYASFASEYCRHKASGSKAPFSWNLAGSPLAWPGRGLTSDQLIQRWLMCGSLAVLGTVQRRCRLTLLAVCGDEGEDDQEAKDDRRALDDLKADCARLTEPSEEAECLSDVSGWLRCRQRPHSRVCTHLAVKKHCRRDKESSECKSARGKRIQQLSGGGEGAEALWRPKDKRGPKSTYGAFKENFGKLVLKLRNIFF